MLCQSGFTEVPGKVSHTNWVHPLYDGKIMLSGKDGADAKLYQEKEVKQAIKKLEKKKEDE
ncbi:type II toxin-antitoxin system HicA family toxin [Nostoc sp.]|uniref:type II toxin-antitoxin system HicA family toxin n=1 Tax=Nostoc sp. TaxID=1180 RepID=UPI002FF7FEA9